MYRYGLHSHLHHGPSEILTRDFMKKGDPGRAYYYGIDIVRFLAALMVAIFHLSWQTPGVTGLAPFGWVGVQVFFVISGIVIANSAASATPIDFIKSRLLRLYPVAWVCSVAGLVAYLLQGDADTLLLERFLKSFFLFVVGPWLATAYWTLPVEISFYCCIFVLLVAGQIFNLERFAGMLTLASVFYLLLLSAHLAGHWPNEAIQFNYGPKNMFLVRHGVFFSLGMYAWLYANGRLTFGGRLMATVAVIGSLMEIACKAFELTSKSLVSMPFGDLTVIVLIVWVAMGGITVFVACNNRLPFRMAASQLSILKVLGLAAYPYYLLHEAIGIPIVKLLTNEGIAALYSIFMALLFVLLISGLVVVVIEPITRRRLSIVLDAFDMKFLSNQKALRFLYRPNSPTLERS